MHELHIVVRAQHGRRRRRAARAEQHNVFDLSVPTRVHGPHERDGQDEDNKVSHDGDENVAHE